MTHVTRVLLSLIIVIAAFVIEAEELLRKNNVEYLGWLNTSDKTKFTTCSGSRIDVGDGKIEKTEDKCETTILYPPLLGKVAKVEKITPSTSNLHVADIAGVIHQFMLATPADSLRVIAGAKVVAVTSGGERVSIAYATEKEPNARPLVFKLADEARREKRK